MAEVAKGIIEIELNTGSAASELKALQAQINAFNVALNKGNRAQGDFSKNYAEDLKASINSTKYLTAETVKLSSAAFTLDKNLSKGKTSLGQFFSAKFNKDSAIAAETMALAAERARRLQTQFIATSGAANGFQDALAVRPLAAYTSQAVVAAQRTEILNNMFKQGTTQLINFGKNVQWAGRQLMVGFTVPLTIFGSVAGKTFMDLEKQAVAFKKVYGDIFTTPAELDKNLEAVKGLASEYTKYGIAVKDTIGLAAQAAAAGRQNADLTDAVSQATRLATLGQMDQNAALETTISLQSAFRLSGKDLADTINFLNMVENQTVVSLQDIAAAIPRVAPVIQGLGGNVKDLTVFLAAMQEGGVDAAEGANALKSGLASLINPTKQATEMLNGMGINLETIIQANKGDLMGTVQAFAEALSGLDQFSRQQALEQVFGKFQYAKLGALFDNISRKGSQAQQVIATMGYSTEQLGATADKELKTIEESFGVQLTGAVERFKLAIAPIGQLFVQLAIPVVNFVTKIIEGFNSLSDGQKRFIAIATVITGVVVPAVTMLAGLFLNLVGTLSKMGQGAYLFFKGLLTGGPVGALKALSQSSKYLSLAEIDAAQAATQLSSANEILNKTLIEQAGSADITTLAINRLARAYSNMISHQRNAAFKDMENFSVANASRVNAEKAGKTSAVTLRTLRRNSGGGVPGVGNTDTVPAMLTPGEFVVNKEATSKNLDLLRAINGGKVSGYKSGGKIPGVQYLEYGDMVQAYIDLIESGTGSYEQAMELSNLDDKTKEALTKYFYPDGYKKADQQSKAVYKIKDLDEFRRTIDLRKETLKKKTTFAHMQFPVLGVATSTTDYKGGKPSIFGDDAIQWLEDFYKSDPNSFTEQQKHYFEAGKLNRFKGWTAVGNLGFDISSFLNVGTNEVKDLIRDLNIRKKVGIDPYETMIKSMGITDISEIKKISDSIHKEVIQELKTLMNSGKTTYIDTDLYPNMEKVVPRAIEKGISGTSRDPRVIRKLFEPSVKMAAIRARGFTFEDIDELLKNGKLSPEDVTEYLGQAGQKKKMVSLPGFKDLGQEIRTSGTGISRQGRSYFSAPREAQLQKLGTLAVAALSKRGIKLLNSGGNVPGSGNSDTVPAMLTPGEFVVNKKATSQNQQLLEMINGGKVRGYEEGGLVQGEDGKWRRSNGQFASKAEIDAHLAATSKTGRVSGIANRIKSVRPTAALTSLGMAGSVAGMATNNSALMTASMVAGMAPMLKTPAMAAVKALGGLGAPVLAATAGFALAGFAIYKLNKQVEKASSAGADMTKAMYGTVESTEQMAKFFGKQTFATMSRLSSVEQAYGSKISEEAQQKSTGFVESDAGKAMVESIASIKSGSGDAVKALRNQLSAGIISGAIGMEEANAIALEVGNAIGDKKIAVQVSGELNQLFGPDGKDILKNLSTITTEISPRINSNDIAAAAAYAYSELAPLEKMFTNIFKGGKDGFEDTYKLEQISADIAVTFRNEANALELLSAAYKEGTVNVQEFVKQRSFITNAGQNSLESSAKTLGFENAQALNEAAISKGAILPGRGGMQSVFTGDEKKAKQLLKEMQDAYRKSLEDSGMLPALVDAAMAKAKDFDLTTLGMLASNQIDEIDIPIVTKMQGDLSPEDFQNFMTNFALLKNVPNIEKTFNFNSSDAPELMQTIVDKSVELQKDPEIVNRFLLKDEFSNVFQAFGINYDKFANLDDISKVMLMEYVTTYETKDAAYKVAADGGGSGENRNLKQTTTDDTQMMELTAQARKKQLELEKTFTDKTGGGGNDAKKELEDLLKMLMERFKLQEMLIDKDAEAYNNRVKQLNREIELEERQVSLRQKSLDQLSKKEEEVNNAYDLRVKALDKVSESNSRISEQQRSATSLASALASGDVAAAANIANEMQEQSAQYRIEDTRAALEEQKQKDLESLTVSINGQLMTRKGIELEIETIQDRIYNRGQEIQGLQDSLLVLEEKKLGIAKEREKIETRMYLLEQQSAIQKLSGKKLTKEQKAELAEYKASYNQVVDMYNAANPGSKIEKKNYGGMIAKMAFGGIAYKGSNEPAPALRMNYGSTVPGIGMTDKVPALLTPGEFVVRKSVAEQYGGFLNQLNGQVFPGLGQGMSSPKYSIPESSVTNIPVNNTNVVSTSAPMYNSTYNVNVNVSGTNASPDDIANVVMAKLSNQNRGNLRSSRY